MIIKEYRIIMPMTVDEYQIGQLYTIQKKSRLESEGAGSGVEIITNEPYENGDERGQYTYKVYHVDQRMPPNLKTIIGLIFPKSALLFEEEGWNRYPYTRTKYKHQLFKGFSIDIETQFNSDLGENENVFNLSKTELSNRVVEIVDIVNDTVSMHDYKESEDPKTYKSVKTSRGPLSSNWIEELKQRRNEGGKVTYMCGYKLCRVECSIWGMQSRIEKTICETVIRNMLLMAHRQAWCWQDEYVDLSLQQVRLLEAETQQILNEKMRQHTLGSANEVDKLPKPLIVKNNSSTTLDAKNTITEIPEDEISTCSSISIKKKGAIALVNKGLNMDSTCNSRSQSAKINFKDSISIISDEFFDAKSICSGNFKKEEITKRTVTPLSISSFASNVNGRGPLPSVLNLSNRPSLTGAIENPANTLVLVIHGGNAMNISNSVNNDFTYLKLTFDKVIKSCYFQTKGRIDYRLVACGDLCRDALTELASLFAFTSQQNSASEISEAPISYHLYENIPYHVLPLFAISKSKEYTEKLTKLICECNRVYQEFVALNGEIPFNGQVVIIGDSMGSILAFDAITPNALTDRRLEFNVAHFFSFGSLLGLLLAFRKHTGVHIPEKLGCKQMYNMFHLNDPLAIRIEPLLSKEFSRIEPCTIPPFSTYPYGDGTPFLLDVHLMQHRDLFENNKTDSIDFLRTASKNWWGSDRIDYVLYSPENLASFPKQSLPYLFHGCFWESVDAAAFILRTILKVHDPNYLKNNITPANMTKGESEKCIKRSNKVKLKNLAPNHRANDVIALVDHEQVLTAKFSYGPLDFALSGEKVDVYIFKNKEWKYYGTEMTDQHGRLRFKIPPSKRLAQSVHPVMMKVKCDSSVVKFNLCVLPPKTEAVVFSIDASFAANLSLSGSDPKIRAGAVDIVRYWQDLGYLIIYVTARPDIQQSKVTNWLAQHNFPKGVMYFGDRISPLPFRQKAETLRNVVQDNQLILRAGYGAARDIPMYQSMRLDRVNIFVVGKAYKKISTEKATILTSYSAHLNDLKVKTRSANGNAKLILKKSSFSLSSSSSYSNTIHSSPCTSSSFSTNF